MCAAPLEAAGDRLVGQVLDGRFRVEALLGRGAVGAVYRATDIETGAVVALKQWRASVLDEQVRGRFEREATALDTLDHPGIVKVYGHGIADGVPFVALEYLAGQTLEELISAQGALDPALAFEIARQALAAIAYAHARDVVHRDLKPENIFVQRDARGAVQVKILDYGLAKFMQPGQDPKKGAALTMTGMVMGTPLYMPPEQAAGSSVDLPVDVYAMGCVMFEMLTGRPPFLGETNLELLSMHLRTPVPKLADAQPQLGFANELQALIDRAMAKKQTARFPNAGAMLEALERLPHGTVSVRPAALATAHDAAAAPAVAPQARSDAASARANLGVLALAGIFACAVLYLLLR